jgi:hypothetical protein
VREPQKRIAIFGDAVFSYKAISLIFIPFHIVFFNFPWYNMEKEMQIGVNYGKYQSTRRSL